MKHLVSYKLSMDEDSDTMVVTVNYLRSERLCLDKYMTCIEANYPLRQYPTQRLLFSHIPIPLHQRWRMLEMIQPLPPPLPIFEW